MAQTLLPLDDLSTALVPLCEAALRARQSPGASITVVAADQGHHFSYGLKSLRDGGAVTPHTGFDIASCSKAFVSATMAALVAEGRVSWDDPITRYVPEFQLYDPWVTQQATLRDLSANRLGLPRAGLTNFGYDPTLPADHVFASVRHTPPLHPLRQRFGYFNPGHSANAVAIGRITGQGFLATLRARLLGPLGMHHSSGGADVRTELAHQAAWHCMDEGRWTTIDTIFSDQHLGAGGIVVSGLDAAAWLRLHLNGGRVDGHQVIDRRALIETHTPQTVARPGEDIASLFYPGAHMAAYALGWAVSDFEGHALLCHSGASFGVSSMTMLLPRSGIGIAVYLNAAGGDAPPLAYAIAAELLGVEQRDWAAALTLPAAADASNSSAPEAAMLPLAAYAGVFHHPADGPLAIDTMADGNSMVGRLRHGYRLTFTMSALGAHRFALRFDHPEWRSMPAGDKPELVFTVADGQATAARLVAGVLGREFLRETPREDSAHG